MSRHKVEITGVNTANIQVLTSEEMENLFKELKSENKAKASLAREKLVNGNLKLVLSILKRFNKQADNMDDLFQIGCVGLLKAIDNFDLSYNVKFSTYCVPMILGEVKRYLRDNNNSIRVSRSLRDLSYKILKQKEEIIMKGIELNIPFKYTWTCVANDKEACGICNPCRGRKEAFEKISMKDPAKYKEKE